MQLREGPAAKGCKDAAVATEVMAALRGVGPTMIKEWEDREGRVRGQGWRDERREDAGRGSGARAIAKGWRLWGWVGTWDIRAAKVDEFEDAFVKRMRMVAGKEEGLEKWQERRKTYGVWNGAIRGWTGGKVEEEEGIVENVGEETEVVEAEYMEVVGEGGEERIEEEVAAIEI